MMVHAGAGDTDDARNRGTLVNALLHHFQSLSSTAGELRPGIVHRLDKETSGLIIVAKNDRTHQALSEMFSSRSLSKTYLALVHGDLKQDSGNHQCARKSRSSEADAHDDPPHGQRTDGNLALQSVTPAEYALRQVQPGIRADRNRADPPDPRPYGIDRASGR